MGGFRKQDRVPVFSVLIVLLASFGEVAPPVTPCRHTPGWGSYMSFSGLLRGFCNKLRKRRPFSPSGQRRWPERKCTTARPGEGERSRNLVGRMESASLHAAAKVPCSAEQPLGHKGTWRLGRSTSRHDTIKMIHLHWGATRGRLRRGGRLPRLLDQPRRSGDHPPVDPLER